MYKGIPFSPQVALTDGIGAGDTTIPVTDISAFPDAPNLATIGTDEEYPGGEKAGRSGRQRRNRCEERGCYCAEYRQRSRYRCFGRAKYR